MLFLCRDNFTAVAFHGILAHVLFVPCSDIRHDDALKGIMKTKVGTPYYVAPEVCHVLVLTDSCDP
jgi:hypothetical protein